MLGVTLGSLHVDIQGYVLALVENLHGLSGSWVVVSFSVGMEAFGWSLIT